MTVYAIVCSETLKIYVGQHKRDDDLQHYLQQKWYESHKQLKKRSKLYASMRIHPKETWSIHPLVAGIKDKNELDETEQLLIYALKVQHPDVGYNICDGGEGFRGPHSEATKRKISEHHKGINYRYVNGFVPQLQDEIERRRAKQIRQKRTPEQIARFREATKNNGALFGHPVSEHARKLIGEKNKAGWTPERRQAQAEQLKKNLRNRVMPPADFVTEVRI